jgi:alpha-L-fucosidase
MEWPGKKAVIKSLADGSDICKEEIEGVSLLGAAAKLKWSRDKSGLAIEVPENKPCEHAWSFEIRLKE